MPLARRLPYFLTLLAGAAVGFFFGGAAFPGLDDLLGAVLCEVMMTVGGATLAGIVYEIVASLADRS